MSTFSLDDHLVLYAADSLAIYALNPTATLLWKELAAGRDLTALILALAEQAGVTENRVRHDVDTIISEWLAKRLIGNAEPVNGVATRKESNPYARLGTPAEKERGPESLPYKSTYRVLDFLFRVESSDSEVIDEISQVLDHLRVAPRDVSHSPTRIVVRTRADGWQLTEEAEELARCHTRDGLIAYLFTYTHMLGYLRSSSFAAIHGAALSSGNLCVLLPGESGSGKSTLAAALVARGFQCWSDDLVVLTAPPIRIRPYPAKICLKSGSWAALASILPEIDSLTAYTRADGLHVKYLPTDAPTETPVQKTPLKVTHVVFPRYSASGNNQLLTVPRAIAINRIAAAGFDLPGQLSEDWVRAMTQWIGEIACHALEFDDAEEAAARISSLAI